jgi:hypothetical protein
MADVPELEQASLIFAGEVATIAPKDVVHGRTEQRVTYRNVEILMGKKSAFQEPMTIFHPVEKDSPGLSPDLFKPGTKLIIGTDNLYFANYIHRLNQETLVVIHQALEAFVEKLVTFYLDSHNFDLGFDMDDEKAWLDGFYLSLRQIADRVLSPVQDRTGEIKEARDVITYVHNYRKEKEKRDTSSPWTFIFQLGPSPTNTLWAYRPQPPGSLGRWQWNKATQAAAGFQYGQLGWTHTFQFTGSMGGSLGYFQNALAAYQLSLAAMIGNPIDASGASKTWSYLIASVFTQVGLGVGNYAYGSRKEVHVGFLVQAQAGGQLALNIGSVQVIGQGALLYSYLGGQGSTFGAALFGGIQKSF